MILAITGSRTINDRAWGEQMLNQWCAEYGLPDGLVHGDAEGMDSIAKVWAKCLSIPQYALKPDYRAFDNRRRKWRHCANVLSQQHALHEPGRVRRQAKGLYHDD